MRASVVSISAGDAGRVRERVADDLRRVDDAGREEVLVLSVAAL